MEVMENAQAPSSQIVWDLREGADVPPDRFQPMRSAYLSLTVSTIDEAERIYALLSDGGQIFMPMEETFFAFRFAMLRDKFGTSWMILHERPQPAERLEKCKLCRASGGRFMALYGLAS